MLETQFIPATDGSSRSLLIALHGLGDSMEGYRWMPQALALPWLNYLLVNAPAPYYGGYSWYDFAADDPGEDIEISRKLLFGVLDKQQQAGYPADQICLFGFSQGCLMTLEVGVRYPHKLAGLVGVSGYAFKPERAIMELSPVARSQRFLITHGSHDALIPIAQVRRQIEFLKSAGLQIDWREFDKDHTIAGEEELACIRQFVQRAFDEPRQVQRASA